MWQKNNMQSARVQFSATSVESWLVSKIKSFVSEKFGECDCFHIGHPSMRLPFSFGFRSSNDSNARASIDKKIGRALAGLIREKGYDVQKLAAKTGISEPVLKTYVDGTSNLPSSQALLIADALGVSLSVLFADPADK